MNVLSNITKYVKENWISETINKKLVMDSSGLNPFQYSIRNKNIAPKELGDFFEQQNIELCTAKETCSCGEFSYTEQGDFYTYQTYHQSFNAPNETTASLKNKKYEIGGNGTIIEVTNEKNELEITVVSITEGTITNTKDLKNWSSPKISCEDKFSILLAEKLGTYTAILANDKKLRIHAKRLGISTYGSSALLASMVISGIYSYQKGISIYYSWHRKNAGWIPKDITFKNVLNTEKDRVKNNKSFFINQ